MSPAIEALFWGFISGGALVFGAAIGFMVNVPGRGRHADDDRRHHDSRGVRGNS